MVEEEEVLIFEDAESGKPPEEQHRITPTFHLMQSIGLDGKRACLQQTQCEWAMIWTGGEPMAASLVVVCCFVRQQLMSQALPTFSKFNNFHFQRRSTKARRSIKVLFFCSLIAWMYTETGREDQNGGQVELGHPEGIRLA